MPTTVYDLKGLLKAAVRDTNPVILLWHKAMLDVEEEVPEGEWIVPLAETAIRRAGLDLTAVSYSLMVRKVMEAVERVSDTISVEVIDLRTLNPLDLSTVLASVRKTGRLLVVHESPKRCGVGGDLVRQVVESDFLSLKAAPKVLAGADLPIPFSKPLETAYVPQVEDIIREITGLVASDEVVPSG